MTMSSASVRRSFAVNLRGHGLSTDEVLGVTEETLELDLSDNALPRIASLGKQCPNLAILHAARNILTELPILSRLRILNVSDNRLLELNVSSLSELEVLNAAGNRFKTAAQLSGLQECTRLKVVSLARNELHDVSPLVNALQASNLAVLDVLGNPTSLTDNEIAAFPHLAVFNGGFLKGRQNRPLSFSKQEANNAGVFWRPALEQPQTGDEPESSSSLIQEPANMQEHLRLPPLTVHDSAIDMVRPQNPTMRSPTSEIESAFDPSLQAEALASPVSLVERQDSANYQPRPPALTERQDSAQNLQALAEEEAALAALSDVSLPRQDSANELDESVAALRQASSSGLLPTDALSDPERASSTAMSARSDSLHLGFARAASNTPFHAAGLTSSRVISPREIDINRWDSAQPIADPEPSASLEAARLLMRQSPASPSQPYFVPSHSGSNRFLARQDSASDSYPAEGGLLQMDLLDQQTSNLDGAPNLLQQARQLMGTADLAEGEDGPEASMGSIYSTEGRAHSSSYQGQHSPFDQAVTPLSPAWTAACIEEQRQMLQMPSIASGQPWMGQHYSSSSSQGTRKTRMLGASPPGK